VKLTQFFSAVHQGTLRTSSLILFTAKQYPVLFFSQLLQRLQDQSFSDQKPKTVLIEQVSLQALYAQLSTSFLGQSDLLWLGNISGLEPVSLKKELLSVVATYQGPHTLMAFVEADEKLSSTGVCISLDDDLSEVHRREIVTFLFPRLPAIAETVEKILRGMRLASLDQLIMIAQYAQVVGKNAPLFAQEWLKKVIAPESSLFDLSSYFFGRKVEQFWNSWTLLKQEYAAPFWTTYWSEQLWRAHYVIKLYRENKITEAKQLSYRLPFSFLQRDWKNLSAEELQRAHEFLYHGDYAFKNGGSEFFLEVFYASFLTKQI